MFKKTLALGLGLGLIGTATAAFLITTSVKKTPNLLQVTKTNSHQSEVSAFALLDDLAEKLANKNTEDQLYEELFASNSVYQLFLEKASVETKDTFVELLNQKSYDANTKIIEVTKLIHQSLRKIAD